jgi:hypothetical protein
MTVHVTVWVNLRQIQRTILIRRPDRALALGSVGVGSDRPAPLNPIATSVLGK